MDLRKGATADLQRLYDLLQEGELANPPSQVGLRSVGLDRLTECGITKAEPQALLAVLCAVLKERHCVPQTELELVWSGPDKLHSHTRSTAVVVRELFRKAKRSVLVGGCYFSNGAEIFKPLHAAMRDHGVKTRICLDLSNSALSAGPSSPGAQAKQAAKVFLRTHWPFGAPLPELYYDPRSFGENPQSLLHAKCVVIDEELSLVTSANFTRSGQDRNLEVGVQIRDSAFSLRLQAQFLDLISSGTLLACPISSDDLWSDKKVHRDSDWDEILEDMDEAFVPLATQLAELGLRAPNDYGTDLAVGGRMSGCVSLLDWNIGNQLISLVDRAEQEELAPGASHWVYVDADDDPKAVAQTLNAHFLPLCA